MEQLPFRIRGGTILGRDHARENKNRQDGYEAKTIILNGKPYFVGVISDGCGTQKHSETAGTLLPSFIVAQIEHLLNFETPVFQIPIALYPSVIGFLEGIRKQFPFRDPKEIINFIFGNLLATVVGFIISENKGLIFEAGDGFKVVNDEITRIVYEDGNPYIGFHLLPQSKRGGKTSSLPRTFNTQAVDIVNLDYLAIATDGFTEHLLQRMRQEAQPVNLGIQLWMNKINGPRNPNPKDGLFYDDATIVELEQVKE